MSAQNSASIFVYDVDGEGACVMHFAEVVPEGVLVSLGGTVMSPGFWSVQQAMHQRMGHTLTMEIDNERGTVWSVRIGRGDFGAMLDAIAMALAGVPGKRYNGGYRASKN